MTDLRSKLGFFWNRTRIPSVIPTRDRNTVLFHFLRSLPEYVWNDGVLEDNPFTYPEVVTLLEGVTVGGRKLSDEQQILRLSASARRLHEMVKSASFKLDKVSWCDLHAILARDEALEWGHFRGEGTEIGYTPHVALGEAGRHEPAATAPGAPELNRIFSVGVEALHCIESSIERGCATFLFGALHQFFFDGNKRTARLMMNGILMSNDVDAISIPAAKKLEFNQKMVRFYLTKDATEMISFLIDCHPAAEQIRAANADGLS